MDKIKIMPIFGTRPEAIKMAPVIKQFQKDSAFEVIVTVTGQHREMLEQVLHLFNLSVTHNLDIMGHGQSLSQITTRVLQGLDSVFAKDSPSMVLVHGDTTTTFAGALASFYNKIPLGHVEAGLRSHKKYEPFPEELNRKLTSTLADLHFAPTKRGQQNLLNEGVDPESIYITGNTVIDAVLDVASKQEEPLVIDGIDLDIIDGKILLVEAHRRENLGKPMENICESILEIVKSLKDTKVVFPVHKNPQVRNTVYKFLSGKERIYLLEPPSYDKFVHLMKKSHVILTDSGGLQEEGPALGKPVLVMRSVTERPEAVEANTAKLVGTTKDKIVTEAIKLLTDKSQYMAMVNSNNPYGDGKASEKIVELVRKYFA